MNLIRSSLLIFFFTWRKKKNRVPKEKWKQNELYYYHLNIHFFVMVFSSSHPFFLNFLYFISHFSLLSFFFFYFSLSWENIYAQIEFVKQNMPSFLPSASYYTVCFFVWSTEAIASLTLCSNRLLTLQGMLFSLISKIWLPECFRIYNCFFHLFCFSYSCVAFLYNTVLETHFPSCSIVFRK